MKYIRTLLIAVCASVISVSYAQTDFSVVLQWMHENDLTKYETVDAFRPDDPITRGEAAKFVAQYAAFMQLDKNYTDCTFNDIADYDYTLVPHIAESCSYGLLKGSQGNFMPNNNMTESQGITIAMRSLYGMQDETTTPWYKKYYDLGAQAGISTDTDPNLLDSTILTRAQLGTRFYQAAHVNTATDGVKVETGIEIKNNNIYGYLDYSPSKVAQALAQGQHVILFFHADWCPTCRLLDEALEDKNDFPSTLAVFKVHYDTATDLRDTYTITQQHTLIKLNKNEQEIKRNMTATTFDDLRKDLIEGPKI